MKKKVILILILTILFSFLLLFIYHDDFLYSKEIMKIENIETISASSSYNSLGLEEKYFEKSISGIITNGKNKGKYKTILYEETYSSVVTEQYRIGDKVFISDNEIDGLKRDVYIAFLFLFFILLMFIVGEMKGVLSVISVLFNIVIFVFGLHLYFKGLNLLLLCIIESILFTILSLCIAGGYNKKTISAILSVFVSLSLLLLMTFIIIKITNYSDINFNELSYLTIPPEEIILPELLIGSLGAIMDVAITISASISELIEKNPKIPVKNLQVSSKQIGKDIMSTMVNVLFFTYLCSSLPIFVLAVRNGFSVINYISSNFSLELTRFLIGSIGIIGTISVSTFICIKIFKGGIYE